MKSKVGKNKSKKIIPVFKSESDENKFWGKTDATEYFDFKSKAKINFPNLKYSTETISIRLPKSLLDDIKIMANKNDVPYQSLIKILLAEKIAEKKEKYR